MVGCGQVEPTFSDDPLAATGHSLENPDVRVNEVMGQDHPFRIIGPLDSSDQLLDLSLEADR